MLRWRWTPFSLKLDERVRTWSHSFIRLVRRQPGSSLNLLSRPITQIPAARREWMRVKGVGGGKSVARERRFAAMKKTRETLLRRWMHTEPEQGVFSCSFVKPPRFTLELVCKLAAERWTANFHRFNSAWDSEGWTPVMIGSPRRMKDRPDDVTRRWPAASVCSIKWRLMYESTSATKEKCVFSFIFSI